MTTGQLSRQQTRWSWATLILFGFFFASLVVPLRNLALFGLVGAAYPSLKLACWILGIGFSTIGTVGVVLAGGRRSLRPHPYVPTAEEIVLGWDSSAGWLGLGIEAQQRHTLLLGSSGSGKTQLLLSLLAQQVARGGGVLMIDAKVDRSAMRTVLGICKLTNRLHDLRLIWPPDPSISNTWNPLIRGSLAEVMGRVMALWAVDRRGGEAEFWRGQAQVFIRALLGAMKQVNPYVTFNDLYLALTTADVLLWLEGQVPPGTEESAALAAFLSNFRKPNSDALDIDRLKRLTGGAPSYLEAYAWGDLGRIMNSTAPTLDILDAMTQGHIVYVALPILAQTEDAVAMARMLVADLKQAVGALQQRADKPVPPFLVLMDEASAYSNIQGIERLFEQARSANVALVAASQVLSGFAEPNRTTLDFILGNTATKVVMALGDFNSAESMADVIGEQRVWFATETVTAERNISAPWVFPLPTRTSRGSRDALGGSERYDYTIRPETLLNQATGEAVIFARDPDLGGRLYQHARTCLTSIPADLEISLPAVPQVRPVGLDLLRLIQRGFLAQPPLAVSGRGSGRGARGEPARGASTQARKPRRVRRRETEDFVILEPAASGPSQE